MAIELPFREDSPSLYHDPWYTFRFTDDRIIARFHLEGIEAGRQVSVFKITESCWKELLFAFRWSIAYN